MFINYLKKNNLWEENKETFDFGEKIKKNISNKISNASLIDDFIINPKEIHKINIDAKSAKLWGTSLEKATNNGNLLHEIMSKISSNNDLEKVLQNLYDDGRLDKELKEKYCSLVTEIINHEKLSCYYNPDLISFNEKDIILKNNEPIRPDRIVFSSEKEISIIDYKTGKVKKGDYTQINYYEKVLVEMGYIVQNKIIVNTLNNVEVIIF